LFFFTLGLMSKPMLVTLPFLLLLLDYWPLQRFDFPAASAAAVQGSRFRVQSSRFPFFLLLEKLPFLALASASSVVTFLIQRSAGAVSSVEALPLEFRISNALISYARYIGKLFWPADLAVFYPLPKEWPFESVLAAVLLLALVGGSVVFLLRREGAVGSPPASRYSPFLTGWLWFLGTLVPVIGLVQVGQQALADRYTYLPLIGLFIMLAWSFGDVVGRWPGVRAFLAGGLIAALAGCATLTWVQTGYWKNNVTLFEHALAVTHDNAVAHNNLGSSLLTADNPAAAEPHFAEAVRLKPNYSEALANLALCREKQGRQTEAVDLLRRSIQVRPTAAAHYDLANILSKQNQCDDAEAHYRAALQLRPEFVEAWYNFGNMQAARGQREEAEKCFVTALKLRPGYVDIHLTYGSLLAGQQRIEEAIAHFQTAIRLAPDNPDAHFNLASAWNTKGDFAAAACEYAEACRLHPADLEARSGLGLALLSQGKPGEALPQFQEVLRAKPDPQAHYYVALMLEGQGQAAEAVSHYREAIRLNPSSPTYLNNLAWLFAANSDPAVRNGAAAVELAERACALTAHKEPFMLGTLAAAYAEAGRFPDAVVTAEKARDLARAAKQDDIVRKNEELLALYRAGKPYHERQ
jgi:tetratricopeptide (TPR) repeat protein